MGWKSLSLSTKTIGANTTFMNRNIQTILLHLAECNSTRPEEAFRRRDASRLFHPTLFVGFREVGDSGLPSRWEIFRGDLDRSSMGIPEDPRATASNHRKQAGSSLLHWSLASLSIRTFFLDYLSLFNYPSSFPPFYLSGLSIFVLIVRLGESRWT